MSKTRVTTTAAANIALVKYWGKRDGPGNQPATPSLSIGLDDLRTTTNLQFAERDKDQVEFEGSEKADRRIVSFFDLIRDQFNIEQHFRVATQNNFPTGAGLASSASGFAALAIAINELIGLNLSESQLSSLAMQGSGSASRSVAGGYMEVVLAKQSYARSILPARRWPLSVFVAVTSENQKAIGSTEAMQLTARTSPHYQDWVSSHESDMSDARDAIERRDFTKLADISEQNCLKMHAAIMTSTPPILYWNAATIELMGITRELRNGGVPAFFTIDAGPQVKIICPPDSADKVKGAIETINGIKQLIETRVGGDPTIESE